MSTESQEANSSEHSFLQESIKKRFEILTKLGSGAYGHVWKVRCKQSQCIFAIKKVFLAFQNETDAQRVYREIALLTKLNHTNVVKLKEVIASQNKNDIYLLFEYMESDVFKAIKNRVLDQMHKKYIVYQLACALKYLHSAGVLHRDLKPSNILINSSCQVKVCDFGLSRSLHSEFFNKPLMTEFIATRWYRAPEVLLGSKSYSIKSDMWSLGCLIYQLYSRRTLLPGENTIDQITKIVQFKGLPTNQEILSFKAPKAAEILSFFSSQTKPLEYYFDDLECEQIKPILLQLLHYEPEKRWSANQLLECQFLRQFRDYTVEVQSKHPVYLQLNDNRKYKLDRYKQQILKSSTDNKIASASTRRLLLYSYRNNQKEKLSLHGSLNKQGKDNGSRSINTTLRNRIRQSRKYQSACISPAVQQSPVKEQKAPTSSLHIVKRGSCGSSLSNYKHLSQHTQKHKLFQRTTLFKQKTPSLIKRSSSHQKGKINIKASKPIKPEKPNKQNCQQKQRLLKKGQIKHSRHDSVVY